MDNRLFQGIKRYSIDALLISDLTNIKYLTGFSGTYGFLLVLNKDKYLFTDSRYYERAGREVKGVKVHLIKDNWPSILSKYKIKKIGFEADCVSYSTYREWKKKLKRIHFIPTKYLVEKIRQIKKPEEIKLIKDAINITENILSKMKLKVGISELKLSRKIERLIRDIPGAEPSFPVITAFGINSSMPHALPGNKKLIRNEITLIDLGTKISGYCSDLTRTFWVGRITKKFKEIYNIVLTAQKLAIEGIRAGRHICEIDRLARNYIKKQGYGRYFGHSLGHGIGMSVHELPRINSKNKERLEPGMVFSIEPGIYISGWGGIRIEDLVLVTEKGVEILTKTPKVLGDVVI